MFPGSEAPRYVKGMSVCAAFMFFTALLALALRFLLVWENKRLDRKYGPKVEAAIDAKGEILVAEDNYGASFRFML